MQKNKLKNKNVKHLPPVLQTNEVFAMLRQNRELKYRDMLYKMLDQALGLRAQKHLTYRSWFNTPTRIPNANPDLFLILSDCLISVLKIQTDYLHNEAYQIIKNYERQMRNTGM